MWVRIRNWEKEETEEIGEILLIFSSKIAS